MTLIHVRTATPRRDYGIVSGIVGSNVGIEPLVSVVIEGYNELKLATSVTDVLDALAAQDYPLDRVELILVGREEQYREWRQSTQRQEFARVVIVEAEGALYYELKNVGVSRASGEIIAFADSDVHPSPGWLPSIVRAIGEGADVTAGISTFWSRRPLPEALLEAAASVSFGHTVGRRNGVRYDAGGVVAHNLAGRADVLRSLPFRTDQMGRNCCVAFFYADVRDAGLRIELVPGQRSFHSFSPELVRVSVPRAGGVGGVHLAEAQRCGAEQLACAAGRARAAGDRGLVRVPRPARLAAVRPCPRPSPDPPAGALAARPACFAVCPDGRDGRGVLRDCVPRALAGLGGGAVMQATTPA